MEISILKIQRNLKHFTQIYDKNGEEINPIPNGVKITVYCEGTNDRGFVTNTSKKELGLEELIAKSWIKEDYLISLVNA